MRKQHLFLLAGVVILVLHAVSAHAVLITFEEGLGRTPPAFINDLYTGITFQGATSGQPWVYLDATTDLYNISSTNGLKWDGGQYWINGNVAAFTGTSGPDGKITFGNADATYVELGYSSYSTFHLEAYTASGLLPLVSASGAANLRYLNGNEGGPGKLRVDAPTGQSIAYIMVHDTGNFWVIDDLATDATGINILPEPATFLIWSLLGVTGIGFGCWRRRKAASP